MQRSVFLIPLDVKNANRYATKTAPESSIPYEVCFLFFSSGDKTAYFGATYRCLGVCDPSCEKMSCKNKHDKTRQEKYEICIFYSYCHFCNNWGVFVNNQVHIVVISTSLNPKSKSRMVAKKALSHLQSEQVSVDWIDLQDHQLPFCDGYNAKKEPVVVSLQSQIAKADGILLAAPVYNFDLNAASKNLIELTGNAWTNKTVGLLVAAGGMRSGMSPLGMMNSLMLDFRCIVIPRYIYVNPKDFRDDAQPNDSTIERIYELNTELIRVTSALKQSE